MGCCVVIIFRVARHGTGTGTARARHGTARHGTITARHVRRKKGGRKEGGRRGGGGRKVSRTMCVGPHHRPRREKNGMRPAERATIAHPPPPSCRGGGGGGGKIIHRGGDDDQSKAERKQQSEGCSGCIYYIRAHGRRRPTYSRDRRCYPAICAR